MTKFNSFYIQSISRSKRRKKNGTQIAELGPALILIFFAFLFPFINMLYLVSAYAAGWYLNSLELREVACNIPANIGLSNPPDQSYHSVVLPQTHRWNRIFGVSEDIISPQVAQFPPTTPGSNPNIVDKSMVRTTVNVDPLIRMTNVGSLLPLGEIPGLGKPFIFVYTGAIQQEEPGP